MLGLCLSHRLRKDVLDDMDMGGIKVQMAWKKVMEPATANGKEAQCDAGSESPKKLVFEDKDTAYAIGVKADEASRNKPGSWSGLRL